jgi:nucleoside-diphosphate-sugar epimerase
MSEYRDKTVVVTGGTGFIGSRLAERLAFEHRARVNVLVRNWSKATWVSRADVNLFLGDVMLPESLGPPLEGAAVVFHCAMAGSPDLCRRVNVEGTRNLLVACLERGVRRIVFFSTVAVHGPSLHEGLDETAAFRSVGFPYADSKIEAEKLFSDFTRTHGLEGTVIRPTYVWGPNSPLFTIAPVKKMLAGRFALVDGGRGACNAVHVDNVVDLALLLGTRPEAVGEAFLLRDGQRLSWKDFFAHYAAMLGLEVESFLSVPSSRSLRRGLSRALRWPLSSGHEVLGAVIARCGDRAPRVVRYGLRAPRNALRLGAGLVESVLPDPYRRWDLKKYASPGFISIDKARKLLGYVPRVTPAEGMREVEAWLREQNQIPGAFERGQDPPRSFMT